MFMNIYRLVFLISLISISLIAKADKLEYAADGFMWQSYSQYGMYGAKDLSGKIIIPAKYSFIAYERGTFTVKDVNGYIGKYTSEGKIIFPPLKYPFVYEVKDLNMGPFIVKSVDGWGLVSRKGEILLDDIYGHINVVGSGSEENMYRAIIQKDGFNGVADLAGKIIIEPNKYNILHVVFGERRMATYPFQIFGEGSGVCSENGDEIIRTPYYLTSLTGVGKDKYFTIFDGNAEGKLDLDGNVITAINSRKDVLIKENYLVGGKTFSLWRAANNKLFVKDDLNKIIIPPIYDIISDAEGYFICQKGRYQSVINTLGDILIPLDKKYISFIVADNYFRAVDLNNKQSIYGVDGELLFPAIHKIAMMKTPKNIDVTDTLFIFSDNMTFGLKDRYGGLIVDPFWDGMGIMESTEGLYVYVSKSGKFGLCDLSGNLLIQPNYTDISINTSSTMPFFLVKSGDYYGIIDLKGNVIINSDTFEKINFDPRIKQFTCTAGNRKCVFAYNGKLISDNLSQINVDNFVNQADLAFENQQYKKAAKLYGKAITISPSAVLYFNRALSYYNVDNYNKAISDFRRALNLNPSDRVRTRAIDLIGKAEYYQEQKEIRRSQIAQAILGVALTSINYAIQSQAGYTSTPANNSSYSTHSNSSSYDSDYNNDSSSPTTQKKQKCGYCGGKGSTIEYVANFGINEEPWCEECGKRVTSGHYHKKCTYCNGTGER